LDSFSVPYSSHQTGWESQAESCCCSIVFLWAYSSLDTLRSPAWAASPIITAFFCLRTLSCAAILPYLCYMPLLWAVFRCPFGLQSLPTLDTGRFRLPSWAATGSDSPLGLQSLLATAQYRLGAPAWTTILPIIFYDKDYTPSWAAIYSYLSPG